MLSFCANIIAITDSVVFFFFFYRNKTRFINSHINIKVCQILISFRLKISFMLKLHIKDKNEVALSQMIIVVENKSVTDVQIQNKAVCISPSHYWERHISLSSSTSFGKHEGRLGSLALVWQPV